MPSNEIVGCHIHKLIQGGGFRAENLKLRKELIFAMDKANIAKEKAKVLAED